MFRIAICDDETTQLAQIKTYVEQWLLIHPDNTAEIETFTSPLLLLESLDKKGGYDIALLDICMPGILGTDVAREMRHRKDKTEIVFITTSDEYAVDAFALKAAHYILKPFTQAQFAEAMDRVAAHYASHVPKLLSVKSENGELRCVDISEIQYMESCGHAVQFYLNTETCTEARRSLSRLYEELEKLAPGMFITPYKGFLVSLKAIVTINAQCIHLRCGAEIPIRRGDFRDIQARYMAYRFTKKSPVKEARYE